VDNHVASEEETRAIEAEVQNEVDTASTNAKAAAEPNPSNLMTDIYA
jgi:TPP-dependent pyruvate/acetoin dehydrogenase alpha subunit